VIIDSIAQIFFFFVWEFERKNSLFLKEFVIDWSSSECSNQQESLNRSSSLESSKDRHQQTFVWVVRASFLFFFYSNFNLFFFFFFSYLVFSSFLMNNRSLNTKKIKILAKTHRIFTSKHKNQFSMSENFVYSFYQEAKSSFIRFTFFKLITEVSDLFRLSRNTKSRSSTRRIVKNIESHDSMSENFKRKHKTKMNLLKEFVKSNNRSKNRATYNKTSYNRDVVAILLIVSKKKYNLSIFQQKFTSKVVAIVKSLYNLMSNSKKTQYLAQVQKFLNSQTSDYINQSLSYFHVWIMRFLVESSLNNKNLELSIE
jgi:hypothetical protein